MRAFVFSSDRLIKDFDKSNYLCRFQFEELDFMNGTLFCGFLKALFINYIQFLFFRLKCYFSLEERLFRQYAAYCTNLNHKHVLKIV